MKRISGDIVEMYQRLANNLPNTSVVIFDRDMRYTLAEGAFITQLISNKEVITGKLPHELLPPSSVEFLVPMYQRILNGESFSFERNTPEFSYQSYASPIKNDADEIVGGMILTHDMSETKRTEAALRASESRFHSLVDLAPVGIIQTDINGKRVFCNSHWCEITGLTLEQALNSNTEAAIFPNDIEIAGNAWDAMMRTRLPFSNVIFRYLHADGSAVWVSGNGRPMFDENGKVNGYLGTVTDISDIKHLADALNINERRYRTLVDFAPVGIVETDTKGTVILANNYWSKLSGMPIDHNFTENASDTIDPDDFKTVQTIHQNMLETANPIDNLEYRFVHPDGKIVWVSDSSRPVIDTEGEVTSYIIAMTDITERKRLETTLRESEERYHSVVDAMSEGVILHGKDGRIQTTNPAAEQILGLSAEQLTGLTSFDAIWRTVHEDGTPLPPEECPAVVTLRTGIPQTNVIMGVYKADNNLSWLSVNSRPLFSSGDESPSAVVITFSDITEFRKAQQSLSRERDLLRTVIDNTPDYIFLKGEDSRFVLSNTAHTRAAGKTTPEEIIGKSAFDLFLPELALQFYADDQRLMVAGESLINAERETVDADGNHKTVLTTKIPWRDAKGQILGLIGISRDISERKRLENTVRESEERLRVITDNIQDIVTQHDAHGQVVFASESCRTALGYEPQFVIGKHTLDFVHPDEKAQMENTMKTGIKSGKPFITVEFRLRHHDGYYIHMESVIKFLFNDLGKYNGSVFISRDVTERLRMQEMLLEQKKLQTALEKEQELGTLKTLMMQRIAHEFRTPLTIIQSSSETLTKFLDRLTSDQRAARVDSIERQIRSITDMLDQIGLAIYGSFKPNEIYHEATDVSRLCREVAAELETHMHQAGKFILDLPETAVINVDQQVLKRAISNVLRNAARFSPSTAVVQVRLTLNEQMMDFCVKDTGIGILPQEQPRIFEPFFRGSNINEVGGLGVGLTIARAAVEAHDGTITVESAPKQGTTVTLRIPLS